MSEKNTCFLEFPMIFPHWSPIGAPFHDFGVLPDVHVL